MPANTFQSIPTSITSRALSSSFSAEDEARREMMRLNKDFYYGKQEQSLQCVNDDQDPLTLNLTKPTIRKRTSLLYSQKLVREFDGPQGSIALLEQIYKDNDIDTLLLGVDLSSELTGSAFIMPVTDENVEGGIRLRVLDAANTSVVTSEDDPAVLEALSIIRVVDRMREDGSVEKVIKQQIWTVDEVITWEGKSLDNGREIQREVNELNFLPFINFKGEEVIDQYLGHASATGTRTLNEEFNQLLTHLGFMVKMQAFTPIVLSGFSNGETVSYHPGRAISLPAGADGKAIELQPKINETLELLKYLEEKIYETSNVPKVSVIGGAEARSGRELIIRWFPLIQIYAEKRIRFEKYELALANMILDVMDMPHVDGVKVVYPEGGILPVNADEDNLERDIRLNVRTPVDELLRKDPTLTPEEALLIYIDNLEINKMNQPVATNEDSNPDTNDKQDKEVDDKQEK